jgi:Do/DeqQ family serine protease
LKSNFSLKNIPTMFKQLISTFAIAAVGGVVGVGAYKYVGEDSKPVIFQQAQPQLYHSAGMTTAPQDFVEAANKTTDVVVHIKAAQTKAATSMQMNPFRDFFGDDFFGGGDGMPSPQIGTGSGVIVSADGYIVTNNHVIDNADELTVTLHDNRSFKAKVVGADPSTDLALIKIEAEKLPAVVMGNSDAVKIGEWVLAVGNPFNLTSTVTAGIVSAKARNINILRTRDRGGKGLPPIEAFIQTDAAVNPGNSGGALVNTKGELIGINTAIASQTGSYSGYSFAVPVNIVKKVMEDLLKFGVVQRAFLGITIRDMNSELAREMDVNVVEGVYVDSVMANSSAFDGGVKKKDIIIKIDETPVKTVPQLQEMIGRKRPGDEVKLTILRDGKEKILNMTLKNRDNKKEVVKKSPDNVLDVLGVELESIDEKTAKKLNISGGVKVKEISSGKIRMNTDMREGFIITKVDRQTVKSVDDITNILKDKKGGVMLEGIYETAPNSVYYYAFGM